MSAWIRASKVRHVHGSTDTNKENHFSNLSAQTNSTLLSASSTHFGYVSSSLSSTLSLIPFTAKGRHATQQKVTVGAGGSVKSFDFDPHDNGRIVTGTDEGKIEMFDYYKGGESIENASVVAELSTGNKLQSLHLHPSASHVVAASDSHKVSIFDLSSSTASPICKTDPTSEIVDFSFGYDGASLLICSKDKHMRVFDPRQSGNSAHSHSTVAHKSNKNMHCLALGDTNNVLSVGQSMMREREVSLWDIRSFSTPVQKERLDTSSGDLIPFFDVGTGLLFLVGRGDTNARIFEFSMEKLHPINNSGMGGSPVKNICMVPKRGLDIMDCEVVRMLKMTENSCVEPISYKIPRRDKHVFYEELFPFAPKYEAAMTAEEYAKGGNKKPVLGSLNPAKVNSSDGGVGKGDEQKTGVVNAEATDEARPLSSSATTNRVPSVRGLKSTSRYGNGTSQYRNVYGKNLAKSESYFNLEPKISTMDTSLLAANESFFALPYKGGGGQVYVSKLSNTGKVEVNRPLLNTGHTKSVCALNFNRFDSHFLATGSDDCTVKLFNLNEDGAAIDAGLTLTGHRNSVREVNFHPLTRDVLLTSSLDNTVKIWNCSTQQECFNLPSSEHPESINNTAWSFDGKLCASSCKDKNIRICDPRSGKVESVSKAHNGPRTHVNWCGRKDRADVILTTGQGLSGDRQVALWDPRNMCKSLCTKTVDSANGVLFTHFDEGTGLAYLIGRGDRNIKYYDVNKEENEVKWDATPCSDFVCSGEPLCGFAVLPRKLLDVSNCEVLRMLRLGQREIDPISFFLPRSEKFKDYFQDDVYGLTRSACEESVSGSDWLNNEEGSVEYKWEDLRPSDMPILSQRRLSIEKEKKIDSFRAEIDKAEKEEKQKSDMFSKMRAMAVTNEKWNPNTSMGGSKGGKEKNNNVSTGAVVGGIKRAANDATPIYDSDSSDSGWDD